MSPVGTLRTSRDVRLKSVMRIKADARGLFIELHKIHSVRVT